MSMINANNVVNLNTVNDVDEFSLPANTPELIKSAKRIADRKVAYLMQFMFEHVDDCLFEYADKAENNQVQSEYFDAMRIIRLKKEKMVKTYNSEFSKQFMQSLNDPSHMGSLSQSKAPADVEFEGLSLVEEDDLEESLAIGNMIRKILNQFKHSLYTMARRMDFVMGEIGFTSEKNPLSPSVVCEAFLASVDTLELNIKIKLIIFKLFDKFVVQGIGVMYDDINSMFIAAGVLPTIKFKAPVIIRNNPQASRGLQQEFPQESPNGIEHPNGANGYQTNIQGMGGQNHGLQNQGLHNQGPQAYGVPQNYGSQGYGSQNPGPQNLGPQHYGGQNYGPQGYGGQNFGPQGYGSQDYDENNYILETALNVGTDPFALIQQLLINQRQGFAPAQGTGSGPIYHDENTAGVPNYVTQEVITGLSGLQQSGNIQFNGGENQASAQYIKTNLVQEISRMQGGAEPKSVERSEADTIDIVSMMFDYILTDSGIPEVIKAQIILLQIPMVKVAILDKTFFAKKTHPARLLLNELAYVGDTLDDDIEVENDPIFQQIEYTVARILSEFESNVELFEELLNEFKLVVKEEVEANKLAEELIAQTKETVAAEIELRLENNRIPKLVQQFLLSSWKDVLKIIGVRDECEGSAWDASLKTMDDLVWSVQPKLVISERQRLIRLIPNLLDALQDGLLLIDYGQDDVEQLFDQLEKLHVASLRLDQITSSEKTANPTVNAETNAKVEGEGGGDKDTVGVAIDDIIAEGSRHDAYERDLVDPVLTSSDYYQFVQNMELETWLEFTINNKPKRGKLSWKCDFTGDYTFIDRKYKVVADISMRELIKLLENKMARYVENVPVFDRAINSIVNSLKKYIDPGSNDLVVADQ